MLLVFSISPTDVAVAASGDIFVTEGHLQGNNRISKTSRKDGKFIKMWGKKRSGPGELLCAAHHRHRFPGPPFRG